jgi:hypothetical protein
MTHRLKYHKTVRKYVNTLTEKAEIGEHTAGISDGNWTPCEQIITNVADEVVKEEGRRQRNDWFGEKYEEVTQRKNAPYKEIIRKRFTRKNVEEYKELRRQDKIVGKMKKKLFH